MVLPRTDLGRGGVRVSTLALGAAQVGNLYREVSSADASATIEEALALGVTYFDTAPHYGLGLSERRLGEAISRRAAENVVVSTKVGRLIRDNPNFDGGLDDEGFAVPASQYRVRDYSYDGTLRSLEESLIRLGRDSVDIVFVHDPEGFEKEALEGAFPALERMRSEGVIRSYGAGMNESAMLTRFVEQTELDVVMIAGRFSLLEQPALEDLLPQALARGVSVVAAGVFSSGILARKIPQRTAHYNYEQAPPTLFAAARGLAAAADSAGFSLPQVAAQFPFLHPAVKVVCLGARSAVQMAENSALFTNDVPRSFYLELAEAGLVSARALDY